MPQVPSLPQKEIGVLVSLFFSVKEKLEMLISEEVELVFHIPWESHLIINLQVAWEKRQGEAP